LASFARLHVLHAGDEAAHLLRIVIERSFLELIDDVLVERGTENFSEFAFEYATERYDLGLHKEFPFRCMFKGADA
jgi:hypothetical protein